jgi:hypothetical protein
MDSISDDFIYAPKEDADGGGSNGHASTPPFPNTASVTPQISLERDASLMTITMGSLVNYGCPGATGQVWTNLDISAAAHIFQPQHASHNYSTPPFNHSKGPLLSSTAQRQHPWFTDARCKDLEDIQRVPETQRRA